MRSHNLDENRRALSYTLDSEGSRTTVDELMPSGALASVKVNSDAGGATWAANLTISDDVGTAAQTKPRIGVDGGGNLTAAWIDARTSPARVPVAQH